MQGATIKANEENGRILIARVMHGGAADRSGLIAVGDEVIEVNGINVEGKTPNDVLKILVRHQWVHETHKIEQVLHIGRGRLTWPASSLLSKRHLWSMALTWRGKHTTMYIKYW